MGAGMEINFATNKLVHYAFLIKHLKASFRIISAKVEIET